MNDIPISQASFTEVLVRVTFRLIHRYDFAAQGETLTPPEQMYRLQAWLHSAGFEALACFAYRYASDWSECYRTLDLRDNLIIRARQGATWRQVAHPSYKNARRDPRVTNRGVINPHPSKEV